MGNLSASVLREIARQSGVHIYVDYDTPVFVNSGFIGVYNTRNEITRITLPFDGEFEELFSGKRYQSVQGVVELPTGENPAQILIIEGETEWMN